MDINSKKNKFISVDESFVQRNPSLGICRKLPHWLKHRSVAGICAFSTFIGLSIIVAVLVVYFTSQKAINEACQMTFKRAAEPVIGYDSRPHHLAVGDFNKNGHLDIVVANSGSNTIGIFLGHGDGTFNIQTTYSTGLRSRPYAVAVGDFNNDTLLDIVVANNGINSIGVLLGYGNGSFASPIITSLGSSRPLALATGDFNVDNQLDIAVANYGTSTISVLFGNNNGTFQNETTYYMGHDSIPYSLVVGDFNTDKQLDIAIVNYGTSELAILLSNENNTFMIEKYSTGYGSQPSSVAIGDFNKDNKLDLAVANSATNNVGIFLGHGNGTFTKTIINLTGFNSRLRAIVVSDLNNDTNLDLIVVDSGNNNIILLRGDGNDSFSTITTHSTGYNSDPCSIAIGDFNDDNKADITIANSITNNILILTAYAIYPAASQTLYSTGTNSKPVSVVSGDFNNDNFSDIIVINENTNNVGIFINLGNGSFGNQIEFFTGKDSNPHFVAVGDVNNDSQLDIMIVMKSISELHILFGSGNGTFIFGGSYSTGNNSTPESLAIGDLNNDGNLDIIVANSKTKNVGIFFGYGDGIFTNVTTYLNEIGFSLRHVVLNDLNNDKMLDIVASAPNDGSIVILLGSGNGSFDISVIISINDTSPYSLAIGDLNNDYLLDIVYASPLSSNIGILLGYGNATFGNVIKISMEQGSWPTYVVLVHFNNDAQLDIAITNTYGYNIRILFGHGNGSFITQKTFSTGYSSVPSSIAFSDFNNDDQLDIVVCNYETNNIGVFLTYYELDFAYTRSYITGSSPHPYSVAMGDFNNDNQLDIVVANSGNDEIQLLFTYNNQTFMSNNTYSTGIGSYPQFVTVADFNKDDQLDVVVANSKSNTINVFLGFSNGTFDTPSIYSTGSDSSPNSIAIGDFNKDNRTDIVVANYGTNNISVFLGFDYPTFTDETIRIPGFSSVPNAILTSDFNNDHYSDIIVGNIQRDNIGVFLGYGNGTFAKPIFFSTVSVPLSIAIGDLNGDNQLDIIVGSGAENNIGIYLGHGNGSFHAQMTCPTGLSSCPCAVAVGDFNKDNILDVVVVKYNSNNIGIFIGYGNGTFADQILYGIPNESYPLWVAVNDLNNDNILDIAVANYVENNIGIFFGYGNGSFRDMISLFTGTNSGPCSVAIGDINNDTWMDIVVANQNGRYVGIFFGYNNGTFSSQTTYSTGFQSTLTSITINDLNNDMILDISVSDYGNGNGNVGVFYGYGNGNFATLKRYPIGMNSDPEMIAIGDFNNDGRIDLAISKRNHDSIGIMLQHSIEPFASPTIYSTGNDSHPKSVVTGDFNNDHHLDIAVANSGTSTIGILLGIGDGTFAKQRTYSTGIDSEPVSIAVGDFNNDNCLDIVVANSKINTILILRGYGNGDFIPLKTYSIGINSYPTSITMKDLNKDNYLDMIVTNIASDDVLVFLGSRNGTFSQPKSYPLDYDARPQSVSIGDINNDGLLDIIVANYGTDYVELFLQTCEFTNS